MAQSSRAARAACYGAQVASDQARCDFEHAVTSAASAREFARDAYLLEFSQASAEDSYASARAMAEAAAKICTALRNASMQAAYAAAEAANALDLAQQAVELSNAEMATYDGDTGGTGYTECVGSSGGSGGSENN